VVSGIDGILNNIFVELSLYRPSLPPAMGFLASAAKVMMAAVVAMVK
jgi:hypothetical protein